MKKSPVVHFELPATDKQRVSKFYETAFGWGMQKLGPEMGEYILAITTDVDEKGRPTTPGSINGGVFMKEGTNSDQNLSIVISVENLDESIKAVKDAGGEVLGEPMDIHGVGKYIAIKDTEGNKLGMLQPAME